MSTMLSAAQLPPDFDIPGDRRTVRAYWAALGVFTLLFVGSGVTTLQASYDTYSRLGFTEPWQVWFNAIGKIAGLAVLWHNRSTTLKNFAYAGYLLDIMLAGCGHLAQREGGGLVLVVVALIVWMAAFVANRRVYLVRD
jgi:hypothetical protein